MCACMKNKTLLIVLFSLYSAAAWANVPVVQFNSGQTGLNVPLQNNMNTSSYGNEGFISAGWLFDGDAARTSSSDVARYYTTVEGQTATAAMPTNQDWLVVIDYKHTGGYAVTNQPWFVKNDGDDIRLVGLFNDGGGDNWSVRIGNGDGSGWVSLVPGLQLSVYWNVFKIHYKSATQKLDIYLNKQLIATDVILPHGRYDPDFVQLESIGAGTDWFAKVKIGSMIIPTRSDTFGHEWVRSHPFITQGLVLRYDSLLDPKYRKCNFTNVMCWENNVGLMDKAKEKQGLTWHWHTGDERQLDDTLISEINTFFQNRPGGTAVVAPDEPVRPTFHDLDEIYDWLHENYPDLLVYGNFDAALNPNRPGSNYGQEYGMPYNYTLSQYEDPPVPYDYNEFVDDYLHVVEPDILLVDAYPFGDTTEADESTEQYLRERSYYRQLELVRVAAMRANIPYWLTIQSGDYGGVYLPSSSDMTMQIYSSLAYGFKGISYFVFDNLGNYGDGDGGLLRYADANENSYVTNPLYDDAQRINTELFNLGRTLKFLTSTQIRYILGTHLEGGIPVANTLPLASVAFNPAIDATYITSITATNSGTIPDRPSGDMLIGYFTPADESMDGPSYENEIYFMVTNLLRERDFGYYDARQQVHIEFDFGSSGITELQRLHRGFGNIVIMPLTHIGGSQYSLDLVLTGGELLKFNTGAAFINENIATKIAHIAPGPGLNAPFEDSATQIEYGVNLGVTGIAWNTFAGQMSLVSSSAQYGTSLFNDNSTVTDMPTNQDWVFKITYASNGSNFNDQTFVVKAHEGEAGEQNVIDLVNNGFGVWGLRCGGNVVASDMDFDDGAFHTLVVHFKTTSQTLDGYFDDKIVASDFTASHGDYAVNYVQLISHRSVGSFDFFHCIEIGQVSPTSIAFCGDLEHPVPMGDLDFNCVVDLNDLILLTEHWVESTVP
jgi:hypothetical protein